MCCGRKWLAEQRLLGLQQRQRASPLCLAAAVVVTDCAVIALAKVGPAATIATTALQSPSLWRLARDYFAAAFFAWLVAHLLANDCSSPRRFSRSLPNVVVV